MGTTRLGAPCKRPVVWPGPCGHTRIFFVDCSWGQARSSDSSAAESLPGPALEEQSSGSNSNRDSTTTQGTGGAATGSSTNNGGTQSAAVLTANTISSATTGTASTADIPFRDGWAPLGENQYGVQGAFWVATDLGGSVAAGSFDDVSCIRGAVAQVRVGAGGGPDFGYYWGALLGFNLNQERASDAALPYDARAHGVAGFGFVVAGTNPVPVGGELRINVKVAGDDSIYCSRVIGSGPTTYTFASIRENCWENDPAAATPDLSRIEALQWQFATNRDHGYGFDLCIEQLWVIPG